MSTDGSVELRFHHHRVLTDADGKPRTLGPGGMGVTYLAEDLNLKRTVALKVIRPEFLVRDSTASARFIREAQSLAKLAGCPNVVAVYHFGIEAGSHFYTMEFVPGENLEVRVGRLGPLSLVDALNLFVQAAEALREAHAMNLVHRDVKPSNLMLTPRPPRRDRLKLIDFGLAKEFSPEKDTAGAITGNVAPFTPVYASPEQCRYAPADARSDLYSLGVSLWFALVGEPPFRPDANRVSTGERIWDLQNKHLYTPPPFEHLAAAGVPDDVGDLLNWTLQKEPDHRPQNATELGNRLRACLGNLLTAVGKTPDDSPPPPPRRSPQPDNTPTSPVTTPGGGSRSRRPEVGAILLPGYRLTAVLDDPPDRTAFRAEEISTGQPVLLRLLPDFLQQEAVDTLRRRVVQFLNAPHPGLRSVFSCQSPPNSLLVAEWREPTATPGGSLCDVLRRHGRLSAAEALTIAAPVAVIADHAAAHRLDTLDLSPTAIFIDLSDPPTDGAAGEPAAQRVIVDTVPTVLAALPVNVVGHGETIGRPALTVGAHGAVRAMAWLVYEMLTGAPPAPGAAGIHPIPSLREEAYTLLADALRQRDHGFINAEAFVGALFRAAGSPLEKWPTRRPASPPPPTSKPPTSNPPPPPSPPIRDVSRRPMPWETAVRGLTDRPFFWIVTLSGLLCGALSTHAVVNKVKVGGLLFYLLPTLDWFPGLCFGLVLGFWLWWVKWLRPIKLVALLPVAAALAYVGAYLVAELTNIWLGESLKSILGFKSLAGGIDSAAGSLGQATVAALLLGVAGVAGGLVGASLLGSALALVAPPFRHRAAWVPLWLTGVLAGMGLLVVEPMSRWLTTGHDGMAWGYRIFVTLWQGVVAASLAGVLIREPEANNAATVAPPVRRRVSWPAWVAIVAWALWGGLWTFGLIALTLNPWASTPPPVPTPTPTPTPTAPHTTFVLPGQSIQAAITAAQPGDTVLVRAGIYREQLVFKEGINLVGEGMDHTFVQCPAAKGAVLQVNGCNSGFISDLAFEHTERTGTTVFYPGVSLKGSAIQLRRCWARDAKGSNVVCTEGDRSLVWNCVLEASEVTGCYVTGVGTAPTVVDNLMQGNAGTGLIFLEGAGGRAEANTCINNCGCGIQVRGGGTTPALTANTADGNKSHGIVFDLGGRGTARGNTCDSNRDTGIAVFNVGTAPTLEGNFCRYNDGYGVYVSADAAPIGANAQINTVQGNKKGEVYNAKL